MDTPETPLRAAQAAAAAERYRAIAQPIRLRLLGVLAPARGLIVAELAAALGVSLAAALGVSLATASRHAALLSANGFVERQRIGNCVWYRLTEAGVAVLRSAHVVEQPAAPGIETPRPAARLADFADGEVEMYVAIGAGYMRYDTPDGREWNRLMERQFGEEIRPFLAELRAEVMKTLGASE